MKITQFVRNNFFNRAEILLKSVLLFEKYFTFATYFCYVLAPLCVASTNN